MRTSRAACVLIAPLWLVGCLSDDGPAPQSRPPPVAVTPPPAAPDAIDETRPEDGLQAVNAGEARLRIVEAEILGSNDASKLAFEGALEIINAGDADASLGRYTIRTDDIAWRLPEATLRPGELFVASGLEALDGSGASFLSSAVRWLALVNGDGYSVDEIEVPASVAGGVLTRYPISTSRPYVYPLERASVGAANRDLGFVRKLASGTEFAPRDSSTNAIVTHDGYHWVLGGWSHFGEDDWHSYTDVWRSRDGVHWQLVNPDPPYSHYSSFVTWRDRMWVIGERSYSSSDGIEWRPEALSSPGLNQSVVMGDVLVNVQGNIVQISQDGEQWTLLTETAPWTYERVQPLVVAYAGRLWVMGGLEYYGEPRETYFNDVWSSSNGVDWELVTPYAAWSPRLWASAAVYDGKLFVIGGMNATDWPDDYGNSAEIWFTEDGVDWFPLESELRWGARHASYATVDDENGVLVIAGYGHGGAERIYNDVWSLKVSIYFAKPEGDVRDLATWGKHKDGSGEAPLSFDAPNQLFVLRNRSSFSIDESWAVEGAGSRIVVGDGQRTHSVELHIANSAPPRHPLMLLANSTTFVEGCSPAVHLQNVEAAYIDDSVPCDGDEDGRD
jgi:hypothetical protein